MPDPYKDHVAWSRRIERYRTMTYPQLQTLWNKNIKIQRDIEFVLKEKLGAPEKGETNHEV